MTGTSLNDAVRTPLVVDPRTREVSVPSGLAGLAAAVVVLAPWLRWVHHEFGTWSPAAELTWPLRSLAAVALVTAATAALTLLTRPSPPE